MNLSNTKKMAVIWLCLMPHFSADAQELSPPSSSQILDDISLPIYRTKSQLALSATWNPALPGFKQSQFCFSKPWSSGRMNFRMALYHETFAGTVSNRLEVGWLRQWQPGWTASLAYGYQSINNGIYYGRSSGQRLRIGLLIPLGRQWKWIGSGKVSWSQLDWELKWDSRVIYSSSDKLKFWGGVFWSRPTPDFSGGMEYFLQGDLLLNLSVTNSSRFSAGLLYQRKRMRFLLRFDFQQYLGFKPAHAFDYLYE